MLVHVFTYQGSIWSPIFDPPGKSKRHIVAAPKQKPQVPGAKEQRLFAEKLDAKLSKAQAQLLRRFLGPPKEGIIDVLFGSLGNFSGPGRPIGLIKGHLIFPKEA